MKSTIEKWRPNSKIKVHALMPWLKSHGNGGFTLIEVFIAIAILGISLTALVQASSNYGFNVFNLKSKKSVQDLEPSLQQFLWKRINLFEKEKRCAKEKFSSLVHGQTIGNWAKVRLLDDSVRVSRNATPKEIDSARRCSELKIAGPGDDHFHFCLAIGRIDPEAPPAFSFLSSNRPFVEIFAQLVDLSDRTPITCQTASFLETGGAIIDYGIYWSKAKDRQAIFNQYLGWFYVGNDE